MTKTATPPLSELHDQAVTLLRKYRRAPEGQKTAILRNLAEVMVSIRSHFSRPDGTPDWKGRSYAYRVFIRQLYEDASYSKDEMHTAQAAVRYHLSAVLRERLDLKTLQEYDLVPYTARERSRDHRASKNATLNALTSRDLHGGALLALTACSTLLNRLEVQSLTELDERALTVAEASLADIERRARALRRRVNTLLAEEG